ncbi:MAG TPA: hypothetical protein VN650_00165, partial [Gemmatimonadaceae bacterium]|nr:hypothetical protein [Gemmatimonadaceae bacterium]
MSNRIGSWTHVLGGAPRVIALISLALAGACQSRNANPRGGETTSTGATTAARTDTSGGMAGMPGIRANTAGATMGSMMIDSSMMKMMDSMRTGMTRMDAMSPEQMKAMMASHRQMAGNMLAQMNSEMRSMNMSADPAWTALVDSVRQDLVRMPDVSGPQLKTFMTAHHARMDRLMA